MASHTRTGHIGVDIHMRRRRRVLFALFSFLFFGARDFGLAFTFGGLGACVFGRCFLRSFFFAVFLGGDSIGGCFGVGRSAFFQFLFVFGIL